MHPLELLAVWIQRAKFTGIGFCDQYPFVSLQDNLHLKGSFMCSQLLQAKIRQNKWIQNCFKINWTKLIQPTKSIQRTKYRPNLINVAVSINLMTRLFCNKNMSHARSHSKYYRLQSCLLVKLLPTLWACTLWKILIYRFTDNFYQPQREEHTNILRRVVAA